MTGQGGWPLNVFLTPEQAPFYVGTYFPPEPRHGMPRWRAVLEAVAEAWESARDGGPRAGRPGRCARWAAPRAARLRRADHRRGARPRRVETLRRLYDPVNGGFGRRAEVPAGLADRVPAGPRRARHVARPRCARWPRGGIYDQVGGGFARYAVDATWTVPHFEKMLYDNALLARAYLHGWQVSGEPLLRRVCEETLDWALREMRGPEGGFYSALDADSEGVEGRFYVWTLDELRAALGDEALLGEAVGVLRRRPRAATSRARTCSRAAGPSPPRAAREIRRAPARRARRARAPGTRRQAPDLVERADDLRPRRGRRGAGARRLRRPPRWRAPSSSLRDMRDERRPPAAHLEGRPRATSTATWRTTRTCWRRCWRCMRRRSSPAGTPRRARSPTR